MISSLKEQKNWKTILQDHELALFYGKETGSELRQIDPGSHSDLHATCQLYQLMVFCFLIYRRGIIILPTLKVIMRINGMICDRMKIIPCVTRNIFLKIFFDVDHFFKVFIEFVTTLLLFYVLVFWPRGMWDLRSLTRDRAHTPCTGR